MMNIIKKYLLPSIPNGVARKQQRYLTVWCAAGDVTVGEEIGFSGTPTLDSTLKKVTIDLNTGKGILDEEPGAYLITSSS